MEEGTMKVQDVMTSEVKSCRQETNLAEAAAMMLEYDGLAQTLGRRPDGLRRKHDQCLVLPRVKDLL
jgi:CBS domain-containing protein